MEQDPGSCNRSLLWIALDAGFLPGFVWDGWVEVGDGSKVWDLTFMASRNALVESLLLSGLVWHWWDRRQT